MATTLTLEEVKLDLGITWNDPDTDADVHAKWKRAEDIIERAAGRKINFAEDGFARQVLLDCCRYLRSDAFAQFKIDYAEDLLSLKLEAKVHEDGTNAD